MLIERRSYSQDLVGFADDDDDDDLFNVFWLNT